MAAEKSKASGKNAAYDRLRKAIKEKAPARAYLFYGEESYLRQTYVQQLQELLIPRGSEDFNLHRLSGSRVTTQDVADAVVDTSGKSVAAIAREVRGVLEREGILWQRK